MENINGFVESIHMREDMSTGKNATLIASTLIHGKVTDTFFSEEKRLDCFDIIQYILITTMQTTKPVLT